MNGKFAWYVVWLDHKNWAYTQIQLQEIFSVKSLEAPISMGR
jgi:hypothetical protein